MERLRTSTSDLADPGGYTHGPPHEELRDLRKRHPVFWHPPGVAPGFWAVLGHRQATAVLRDPTRFSSRNGPAIEDPPVHMRAHFTAMLPYQDPPRHDIMRKAVLPAFQSRHTGWLETRVREHTVSAIEAVLRRGEADFAIDLAAETPLRVLCELVGTPSEERHWLRQWTDWVTEGDPRGSLELGAYLRDQLRARRRGAAQNDLLSLALETPAQSEGPLSDEQLAGMLAQIVQGGQETTRNLISGSLLILLQDRTLWDSLAAHPAYIAGAVEEMLRVVTPVQLLRRSVAADVVLGNERLVVGDRVVVFLQAANRDEEVFRAPDEFVLGRRPNLHLSFGLGEHVCIGARMARLETRIFWEEFLRRVSAVEITGPVERMRSAQQAGIHSLPVLVRPA